MNKNWNIYEEFPEMVYVVNFTTKEIAYMNRKARDIYNVRTVEDLRGKTCYEALYHFSDICMSCPCLEASMKTGEFRRTDRYNPYLDKYLLLFTQVFPVGDNLYSIEFAIDNSREMHWQKAEQYFLDIERKIIETVRLSLLQPTPTKTLTHLLSQIGQIFHADHAYIYEPGEDGDFTATFEWNSVDMSAEAQNSSSISREILMPWLECFGARSCIVETDIRTFRDTSAQLYQFLEMRHIHSIIGIPLYDESRRLIGLVGMDNPKISYTSGVAELLELLSSFISATLRRRDLVEKLKVLSYQDHMSGFGNRRALLEFVDKRDPEKSMGVLFSDVTGLKFVNDTQGHDAGDALILRACSVIKDIFKDHAWFRFGGDEFLVLCKGISEDEMKCRIAELREKSEAQGVVLAIGASWAGNSHQIDRIVSEAEAQMYYDKKIYYERTGKDRRHR